MFALLFPAFGQPAASVNAPAHRHGRYRRLRLLLLPFFRGCRTPEQQTFFHVCLDLACCTQHACTGVPAWRASTLSMHDGHVCTLSCIKTPNPSRLPTPVSINALTPAKPCSLPPAQHVRPDTPTPHDTTLWCLAHDG